MPITSRDPGAINSAGKDGSTVRSNSAVYSAQPDHTALILVSCLEISYRSSCAFCAEGREHTGLHSDVQSLAEGTSGLRLAAASGVSSTSAAELR